MSNTWPTKKLGKVIELNYGKGITRDDRDDSGEVPIYGANGVLGWTNRSFASGEAIIVGRKGSAGEVTRISGKFWPSDVTYYVFDNSKVDINYLYYFFKEVDLTKLAVGVKPGINRNRVYEIEIPLPPLTTQKKIVKKIEALFGKIDEAQKFREEAIEATDNLLSAELDEIFSKKKWATHELGMLCNIKHGFAFQSRYFTSSGRYVLLTPGNFFEEGGYRDRGNKQKYYEGPVPSGFILSKDDLLIAMTEQAPGLVGSPIFVPESNRFLHNQRLGLIIFKRQNTTVPKLVYYFFNWQKTRDLIELSTSGTKVRHTAPKRIHKLKIPHPPLSEQKKIVAYLDSLSEKVKQLQELQKQTSEDMKTLKQSILEKAFKGELVRD